jgi:DNA-binding transcriptional ArsR family regulator
MTIPRRDRQPGADERERAAQHGDDVEDRRLGRGRRRRSGGSRADQRGERGRGKAAARERACRKVEAPALRRAGAAHPHRIGHVRSIGRPARLLNPPVGAEQPAIVHLVVNDPFKALSHPIRRGIVERLAAGPATVGDATAGFGVSKPAITKHLKVLEATGVVRREVVGRTHRLSLEPHVLSEAADWMDRQRALWGRLFDVVDEYLKEDNPDEDAADRHS